MAGYTGSDADRRKCKYGDSLLSCSQILYFILKFLIVELHYTKLIMATGKPLVLT